MAFCFSSWVWLFSLMSLMAPCMAEPSANAIIAPEPLPPAPTEKQQNLQTDEPAHPPLPIVPSDAADAPVEAPTRVDKTGKKITPKKQTDGESPSVTQPQPTDKTTPETVSQNLPNITKETQMDYTSISSSKQFIVKGKDSDLCSAISTKAETIRKNLLDALRCDKKWKDNISINLFGTPGSPSPANPIRLAINILAGRPAYIINIHVGRGIELDDLYGAITTMLLYEMMLQEVDVDGLPDNIALPPWLLIGLEQSILWRTDLADRNLYATLFERGEILDPQTLLLEKDPKKNLDATTYSAFKASCGALTLCLLNQKGGQEAMMRILNEAILGSEDPVNLVKRNFPRLNLTPTSLHKWWTLQLSTMATPPVTETMSLQTTETRLTEAIKMLQYNEETRVSRQLQLDNLDEILKLPDLQRQLRNVVNNLIYLGNRCFPTYKPIIVEYTKIIALIQLEKSDPNVLKKRIKDVIELRKRSQTVALRARDYMDWFEISNKRKLSNTFDSYISTLRLLRGNNGKADTPISKYLQQIEELYTLPAEAPTPDFCRPQ
ncbi:MAG: hypothetical protein RSA21_02340 [Akkermansia sp.]